MFDEARILAPLSPGAGVGAMSAVGNSRRRAGARRLPALLGAALAATVAGAFVAGVDEGWLSLWLLGLLAASSLCPASWAGRARD